MVSTAILNFMHALVAIKTEQLTKLFDILVEHTLTLAGKCLKMYAGNSHILNMSYRLMSIILLNIIVNI